MNTLLYDRPADAWEEAVPLGNGFLGAMVYGRTEKELIELNEDSLWTGTGLERRNPLSYDNIEEIRRLLKEGEVEAAQRLTERSMFSTTPHSNHYQPLGQVWLQFWDCDKAENYTRRLDLEKALLQTSYESSGQRLSREAFVSYPDKVFVYHLKGEQGKSLNFDLYATRRDTRPGKTVSYLDSIEYKENCVYLSGYNGNKESGISYVMGVSVRLKGGRLIPYGVRLAVEDAQEATVFVVGRTTYRSDNPRDWCEKQLQKTMKKSYEELKNTHIKEYRSYYNQMSLSFSGNEEHSSLTIPERLEGIRNGNIDPEFAALYFNFGRYLLISSSRPGSLPANLQGIWNNEFEPSWGSKYTININLEMNYWVCEKAGLSELHMPLMELMKTMLPKGKETAKKMYGADGACAHHVTDIWGDCTPADFNTSSTIWPMGFVWLCLHIIEHFDYTGDRNFLEEYIPVLEENAKFLISYLYKAENGCYATGPSVSPENVYITKDGQKASVCSSPSMDIQLIREFFAKYIEICRLLNREAQINTVEKYLNSLPSDKIGRHGQLMEWQEDYDEFEPGHRHVSQLFALYPGTQIRIDDTPELAKAAKKTLERRLLNGGGHTGWSCAWMIHFYSRLRESDKAYAMLKKLFTESTLNNLLDNCPPFQIDGNFGGANAILEMLVQDYGSCVYILPSVCEELGEGRLEGLRLKCGGTLNLIWSKREVETFSIKADRDLKVTVHFGNKQKRLHLSEREIYQYDRQDSSDNDIVRCKSEF